MSQEQTVWPETIGIVAIVAAVLVFVMAEPMTKRHYENQAAERAHVERMAACRKGA